MQMSHSTKSGGESCVRRLRIVFIVKFYTCYVRCGTTPPPYYFFERYNEDLNWVRSSSLLDKETASLPRGRLGHSLTSRRTCRKDYRNKVFESVRPWFGLWNPNFSKWSKGKTNLSCKLLEQSVKIGVSRVADFKYCIGFHIWLRFLALKIIAHLRKSNRVSK